MEAQGSPRWRQEGRLSLWRYVGANRSYQGWHCSADAAGCQSLLALLSAFQEQSPSPYRTISLALPSPNLLAVPGRMFSGAEPITKLRLAYACSPTEWQLAASSDVASLTIGEHWRAKLYEATTALSAGDGDFRIGPEDRKQGLWFWWWRQ